MSTPRDGIEWMEDYLRYGQQAIAIKNFVRDSNKIEGILREPSEAELAITTKLLSKSELTIEDIEEFVTICTEGSAVLRSRYGINVQVGNYIAPLGGVEIPYKLQQLLDRANEAKSTGKGFESSWDIHVAYEQLHPFTDGNGRSGRLVWLWLRNGSYRLPFLHQFYYQTLDKLSNKYFL